LSRDLESEAEKTATDRILISKRAAALESLADLKRNSAKADAYKQAMDKILISQDQLLDFPRWLEEAARIRRLALTFSFQGSEVQPQPNFPGYINFSLDLSGPIDDLTQFLKDFERQEPRFLVSLESFDFVRDGSIYRVLTRGKVFFR